MLYILRTCCGACRAYNSIGRHSDCAFVTLLASLLSGLSSELSVEVSDRSTDEGKIHQLDEKRKHLPVNESLSDLCVRRSSFILIESRD